LNGTQANEQNASLYMNFLIIDDDKTFRDATCLLVEGQGHYVQPAVSGEIGLALLKQNKFDVVLLAVKPGSESGFGILRQIRTFHPSVPVIVFAAESTVGTAVEAMRLGAADFMEKPLAHLGLQAAMARLARGNRKKHERLIDEIIAPKLKNPELLVDFTSSAMRHVNEVMERAAKSSATILINGESGTGKSVLARMIHNHSDLASQPFVTVSCPSLSRELLQSELFGHTQGAFTGAVKDHWGKVRAADGGTLFLDEIGDLPMEIQPKLLRLLQEKEYERLGENVTRTANVRVIAATNCDLQKRVAEGTFREDLYFRLNVISVEMPPLRQRNGDLLRFANHYLSHFAADCGRKMEPFSRKSVSRLEAYSWPGNLRELRNAVQRAVILARSDEISPADLPLELTSMDRLESGHQPGDLVSLKELDDVHIRKVLERTGSILKTAKVLGIDPATLYRRKRRWDKPVYEFPELACA
jgi:NtrC-family two-component system response regulator AlgB